MSGSSKTGFNAPPSSFPAFKKSNSAASRGNSVASSKTRIVTSTYTYQYPYYESKPKTPQRNITRRIQIGDFSINKGMVDNNKSKIKYEIHASYVKNANAGPSSFLSIEAYKVPKKYQKPAGEEFEEWRQNNGNKIAFARYCDGRCSALEANNYDYTTKIESFESKLKKRGIDQYVGMYLGESLTDNFFIPPSLTESREIKITPNKKFTSKVADIITNFNPSTNTLEIDTDSFGIDSSATFATAKNKRKLKKLAKRFRHLYDKRRVVFTSMKMAQTKVLVRVAMMPSLKALLI